MTAKPYAVHRTGNGPDGDLYVSRFASHDVAQGYADHWNAVEGGTAYHVRAAEPKPDPARYLIFLAGFLGLVGAIHLASEGQVVAALLVTLMAPFMASVIVRFLRGAS